MKALACGDHKTITKLHSQAVSAAFDEQ
jgi:hypothetical protein